METIYVALGGLAVGGIVVGLLYSKITAFVARVESRFHNIEVAVFQTPTASK